MPDESAGKVEQIWVKRAHRGKMDAVPRATLVAGRGIVGNADQGRRRQVTLLSRERWDELTAAAGLTSVQIPPTLFSAEESGETALDPIVRRANLLLSGIDLRASLGKTLRIGECRIRILGETRPCERMDEARQGLRAALSAPWGGGAFGEVLDDGDISVGNPARWEQA